MIPDAIHERVEATLPPAREPAAKKPEPARYDTSRFMRDLAHLQRIAWPHPAHVTAVHLAGALAAIERADADGSGYLLDQQLGVLLRLMRGQS